MSAVGQTLSELRRERLETHVRVALQIGGRLTKSSDYYGGWLSECEASEIVTAARRRGCGGEVGRDALGNVCVTLWPIAAGA